MTCITLYSSDLSCVKRYSVICKHSFLKYFLMSHDSFLSRPKKMSIVPFFNVLHSCDWLPCRPLLFIITMGCHPQGILISAAIRMLFWLCMYVCSIQRQLFYCVLCNADICIFHVCSSHWHQLFLDLSWMTHYMFIQIVLSL
jgi:hypothetical protein